MPYSKLGITTHPHDINNIITLLVVMHMVIQFLFSLLPVRQLFPLVDELCSVGGLGHHVRRPHDLGGPVYHDDLIRVHSLLCPEVSYGDVPGPLASASAPFYKGHA